MTEGEVLSIVTGIMIALLFFCTMLGFFLWDSRKTINRLYDEKCFERSCRWSEKITAAGPIEFEKDIHFIVGYLEQGIKMGHPPERTAEILLFLAKEIEKLK